MMSAETIVTFGYAPTPRSGALPPGEGHLSSVPGSLPSSGVERGVDREAAARAIADEAKRGRRPVPRWLWIVSLVVAAACFGALAIGWIESRDATVDRRGTQHVEVATSGFATGFVFGIGVGALAATVLLRRR